MQHFKIRADGFREIRKKMLSGTLPLLIIIGAFAITLSRMRPAAQQHDVNVLPFVIPFILLTAAIGLYRASARQKRLFDSYTLTITNNLISREQFDTPTVSIYFNEVREITKSTSGSLTIRGKETADVIIVPAQIENATMLEETLAGIREITDETKKPLYEKFPLLPVLACLGLMICVYVSQNKIIVGVTGTMLLGLIIWCFFELRNDKNIDEKTRQSAWWLMVVLICVIATMIFKLTGTTAL
jgi:hypothetical protein